MGGASGHRAASRLLAVAGFLAVTSLLAQPVAGFDELRFGCEDCATYGLAVGDLDGDGFPEIVTANSGAPNGIFGNVGVVR